MPIKRKPQPNPGAEFLHNAIEQDKRNSCPKCGGRMVSRANRQTGQRFWGCARFPDCNGTRNTDAPQNRRLPYDPDPSDDRSDRDMPSDRQRDNDRRRWLE